MMKQRFFFACLVLLVAMCDDSEDIYKKANLQPVLLLKKTLANEFSSFLSDSFRIREDEYFFNFSLTDELPYHKLSFDFLFTLGGGAFFFVNNSVISFAPEHLGTNNFNVSVTDEYGKKHSANASIFVFTNLPPVAKLTVSKSTNSYVFDASASYDPDSSFNGGIVLYELTINNNAPITFVDPALVFQGLSFNSPAVIKFRVKDNDGAWSDYVQQIIYP